MRKLASIQRILKIEPIEGADRIEVAHVLGWQCVVNKGQFKEQDLAVYFEIDSFLPVKEQFEFLRSSSYKKTEIMSEGFKLKTMKFKGKVSQGLLLPLSECPELPADVELGMDVTELLGVKKWEVEERATTGGTIIGTLPYDVPHTDETRIQAQPDLLQEFSGLEYYISTKMDGSSHSVSLDENGFHVTGHNYEYKDDGHSSFYELVKAMDLEAKVKTFALLNDIKNITIQGEFCGPGIQQNKLQLVRPAWYVFTVRIDGKRVGLTEMKMVCETLGLNMVPIEEIGVDLPSKYPDTESLLARADGKYECGRPKEGLVIRPVEPVFSELIGASLSMKVINNRFLLKNGD